MLTIRTFFFCALTLKLEKHRRLVVVGKVRKEGEIEREEEKEKDCEREERERVVGEREGEELQGSLDLEEKMREDEERRVAIGLLT